MQIIIVGDGKVGVALTEQLSSEGHDITVIDSNPKVLEQSLESYDVMVVHGNGASIGVLKEAGVEDAHLLIAATSRDETNLLTCIVAKKLGAKHTIARVRNPEYAEQLVLMRDELGLSMTINPELAAAREIHHLLQFPSFLKRDSFAKGRVEIVEIHVGEDSKLAGIPLNRLYEIARVRVLVCVVERGGTVHIPDAASRCRRGTISMSLPILRTLPSSSSILALSSRRCATPSSWAAAASPIIWPCVACTRGWASRSSSRTMSAVWSWPSCFPAPSSSKPTAPGRTFWLQRASAPRTRSSH